MFDDPNPQLTQPTPIVTNDQAAATPTPTTAPPATSGPPSTTGDNQDTSLPKFQQNPNRSVKPAEQIYSNAPPAQPEPQDHPLVKKASLLHSVGRALAGNPTQVTIDDEGNRIVKPMPLSGRQIGMALALEAISGSLTGLAAGRGRGPGAAGAAALSQAAGRTQQKQAYQDELARQQFDDRAKALAQKASIADINARTILNTSEAEKYGSDAIDRVVDINRASGLFDLDPDTLDNAGQPMTQAEMIDGLKSGKLSAMDHIGPIVGRVEITLPDGSKKWEATHLIVKDPTTKVTLTQDDWDRYAGANVPGFPKGTKIGAFGAQVPLSVKARANEILSAHTLADYRLKEMRDTLAETSFADKVPASIDFSQPGVETAIQRFQKYVSHSDQHGMDVYESLQMMGTDKRDPKTGQMQPNPDAKYVETVAQAMGGWSTLEAVHNQLAANKKTASEFGIIDSESKANAVLAAPSKFMKDQVNAAHSFLRLSQEQGAKKAAQEARDRAVAEGKDTEAMFKTGVNPVNGEKLSLANAPDSMLVDSKGRPVPQNQQPFYKPDAQERQTADTARQVLAISADLRAAVGKNPNLVGPLLGNAKQGLAKLGFGDAESQKMLDDVAFLQSAATKMHTGRFSNEILHKMANLIKPGMNSAQFRGALDSIDEVAGRYAQEDKLVTVADYRNMQQASVTSSNTGNTGNTKPARMSGSPPPGATGTAPGSDGKLHWTDGKRDLGVAQ